MFWALESTVTSITARISFFIRYSPFTTRVPIQQNIKMVFACQQDSFLKHLKTKVLSCKGSKLAGKEAFEVILEDTVLFPEGGGQVWNIVNKTLLNITTVSLISQGIG